MNQLLFKLTFCFSLLLLQSIFRDGFDKMAKDPATKAAILTGADPYYCAGMVLVLERD